MSKGYELNDAALGLAIYVGPVPERKSWALCLRVGDTAYAPVAYFRSESAAHTFMLMMSTMFDVAPPEDD